MKSILAVALILVAQAAFAVPSKNQSWNQIRADRNATVMHDFQLFGPEGIFNVCIAGDMFRSIKPIKVCTKYVTTPGYGEISPVTECVASTMSHVSLAQTRCRLQRLVPGPRRTEPRVPEVGHGGGNDETHAEP